MILMGALFQTLFALLVNWHLDFHYSNFGRPIPSQLGNLFKLVDLDLDSNQLIGPFLKNLWNIYSLQTLNLGHNNLGRDVFGFLRSTSNLCTTYLLEELWLADNELTWSVPDEIAKLSNLKVLALGDNRLNGSISPNIGELSNLTTLWLYGGSSFNGVVISKAHSQIYAI